MTSKATLVFLLALVAGAPAWGEPGRARLLYHSGVAGEIDPCG